ncbi:papain family cysteine protease domain-containing protein [Ditylenchus destructor]|uniref:Papain family cysteine protease domain-containing protein n=1 Tax=Ditylenchus destructor TaxID=166010 RepID=A0AAD4R2B3_9BILA|nr:papain family cysteine protease domain-containing protein [Ditylenchus destructor]
MLSTIPSGNWDRAGKWAANWMVNCATASALLDWFMIPTALQPSIQPMSLEDPNANVASTSFDSLTKWPQYASIIGNIRDQSNCGSCWAVLTGSVLTDRKFLHPGRLMTYSGGSADGDVCNGGWPYKAFNTMVTKGVLSGKDYTGCKQFK